MGRVEFFVSGCPDMPQVFDLLAGKRPEAATGQTIHASFISTSFILDATLTRLFAPGRSLTRATPSSMPKLRWALAYDKEAIYR